MTINSITLEAVPLMVEQNNSIHKAISALNVGKSIFNKSASHFLMQSRARVPQ